MSRLPTCKRSSSQLYIGQMRLAHNAIDPDHERFSEETLQKFAETAASFNGKGEALYYEYRGEGELREGSLVYLGAQPGMSIKKGKRSFRITRSGVGET